MKFNSNNKLKQLILSIIVIAVMFACDQDATDPILEEDTVESLAESDTTYTEEELIALIEEELGFVEDEKAGRVENISGMDIVKENPKKVYAHYMPWFQSKDYDGWWGQHWTMTNKNPDIIDENGRREIASYYYPLIGPYSSRDPHLQEYHFLMMKLAGIDGVIFDWYGSRDLYDYGLIKQATETFMDRLDDLGMKFSIMYEDRVAVQAAQQGLANSTIEAAQQDFEYINEYYFSKNMYSRIGGDNLMFVFGPHHITTEQEWNEIFEVIPQNERPDFLTLWAASDRVGPNSRGEFLWVDKDHLAAHEHYYNYYPQFNKITVGGAYPGFKSFYSEGGWSDGVNDWVIEPSGHTFVETMNYTHHEVADVIQLITWNDFGEGTMLEPTEEFGFMYLQLIQQYTGVDATAEDLYVPLDLYKARKKYKDNPEAQEVLDRAYRYMKRLRINRVKRILDAVEVYYG